MKNVRLASHVRPERYKIMLHPDLEKFTFRGEETIYLNLDKPGKEITLHSADLEIESDEAKVSYNEKEETVKLTYNRAIPAGKHQIKLKFKGILNDKMRGFYRSQYGEDRHLAVTQFEATDARRAFPCFDEPSQKAIFDVTLMIPAHTTAISNTVESSVWEHETGLKVVEFEPTPKMSTYLLAFIVGEFEYIENKTKNNILVRVFTTPGKKDQAKFALDVAIKVLKFYENYFGIDYPLPVLDLIAIPDFASGAMENWGAVTYRESTLLIDEASSSTGNKQWVAMVIAHELAHQWFGNLVTMEWWSDLWLNEGFASFIEYLAIDSIFPQWDIWTQFVSSEMGTVFSLDSLKNTHPIEVPVGHPAEISEIFDKVSYSKGATILRMLWKYQGEKDFQKGLQHYLKKHAYGNARTEDLWKALEEVSGKPVGLVMKNWTSKPGHPLVRVQRAHTESGEGNRLQLTQSRFFSSPISKKETQDKTIWSIPLGNILMDKKVVTIPNKGEKLNQNEASFVRVDYPRDYLKKLNNLSAPDRLGLIRDTFDLAQSDQTPTTLALELALSYMKELDYTVWSELTGHISQLDSLLFLEEFYEDFKKYGREIYGRIANKMGWDKKGGEKHTDALLRGMVLYKLGSFGDEDTIKKAQELFKKVNLDPDLRGVVYNLVAENGDLEEFNTLIKMYKKEDNQQEKDRIGRALGLFKRKKLLKKTLEFAISKHVRFQNSLGIIASVWGNPNGRYFAWEFVKANWKMLKERYAGGHYFTRVFQAAGDFTKLSDAKDIESFVRKNPVPEAQRTIAQALEQIYSNAEWLKRDSKVIENFLKKK
ncbi:MAG: puromycin-sensitive aminopeptidase [Microgenomates group bacterium Gr01-1014_7]|nr:MAG: puromycin-sensitive aminopeptidase [Microgenomates group bacterium Gr01-1014_7]